LPSSDGPEKPDLNRLDWAAAERRHATELEAAQRSAAVPNLDLSDRPGSVARAGGKGASPWQSHRRWVYFSRAWAVVKVVISVASMWFTMAYLRAKLSEDLCAYGVLCFWWAAGPLWRKRCFGPGQQLEPELYEAVVKWLWRAGTLLVLVGGAAYVIG
jgi:hypothetical protein